MTRFISLMLLILLPLVASAEKYEYIIASTNNHPGAAMDDINSDGSITSSLFTAHTYPDRIVVIFDHAVSASELISISNAVHGGSGLPDKDPVCAFVEARFSNNLYALMFEEVGSTNVDLYTAPIKEGAIIDIIEEASGYATTNLNQGQQLKLFKHAINVIADMDVVEDICGVGSVNAPYMGGPNP